MNLCALFLEDLEMPLSVLEFVVCKSIEGSKAGEGFDWSVVVVEDIVASNRSILETGYNKTLELPERRS